MTPNKVKDEGAKDFGKGKMPLNTSSKELNDLINKPMTPNKVKEEGVRAIMAYADEEHKPIVENYAKLNNIDLTQ